jgi:hypothetical protein
MDGGDRAGYKQISRNVDATIITSTMSGAVTTGSWYGFEVISSYAAVAAVNASGITNSSLLTSAYALPLGAFVGGGLTTGLRLSAKSTGHKIIAYKKVLL